MGGAGFRFERHYQLWKDGTKELSRWTWATLILAFTLATAILAPYPELATKSAELGKEREKAQAALKQITDTQRSLLQVGTGLAAIRNTIDAQPWTAEADGLMRAVREVHGAYQLLVKTGPQRAREVMRAEPAGTVAQAVAVLRLAPDWHQQVQGTHALSSWAESRQADVVNEGIEGIVKAVRDGVLDPLERMSRVGGPAVPQALRGTLEGMHADLSRWKDERAEELLGSETARENALGKLQDGLRTRQQALSRSVQAQQEHVTRRKAALERKRMLLLYPLGLLVLAGVCFGKALLVRRHYLVVRSVIGRELLLQDASMASPATLVYRGPLATTVTVLIYLASIVAFAALFEYGHRVVEATPADAVDTLSTSVRRWLISLRWLGHLLFAATAGTVIVMLLKDRSSGP